MDLLLLGVYSYHCCFLQKLNLILCVLYFLSPRSAFITGKHCPSTFCTVFHIFLELQEENSVAGFPRILGFI